MINSEINKFKLGGLKDFNKTTLKTICQLPKYKGYSMEEIGEFDSDYIMWLYDSNIIDPDEELLSVIHTTIEQINHKSHEDGLMYIFNMENK